MNLALDVTAGAFVVVGVLFFVSGTVGLLRFPDLYTRLHALTKADSAGLGCIVLALCLRASNLQEVVVLFGVWALVLVTGATACQLVARRAAEEGIAPWVRR
ncbi:MAG: monovalent cation/H(+) antiporter subunit G [Vicinamibacterales bacterium]